MKTIIHLDDTKISSLIFLSSRAILTTGDLRDKVGDLSDKKGALPDRKGDLPVVPANPWDSHYRFETILLSGDERIKSRNYCWGTSSEYFKSFHLFQFTSWMHKRLLTKIRHRLKKLIALERIEAELLVLESNPEPSINGDNDQCDLPRSGSVIVENG